MQIHHLNAPIFDIKITYKLFDWGNHYALAFELTNPTPSRRILLQRLVMRDPNLPHEDEWLALKNFYSLTDLSGFICAVSTLDPTTITSISFSDRSISLFTSKEKAILSKLHLSVLKL